MPVRSPIFLKEFAQQCHPSWNDLIHDAALALDDDYVKALSQSEDWLPGQQNLLNAFSLPLDNVTTLLLGESPYPRIESANGYAFWDANVGSLWSEKGFSKQVNRATSLRNWLKQLLLIRGDLSADNLSQPAIAALDKSHYVPSLAIFFSNLLDAGFLLLNASLVLSSMNKAKEAKIWQPFIERLLTHLVEVKPNLTMLLFGQFAQSAVPADLIQRCHCILAPHPYNISFIHDNATQDFFRPLNLLEKTHD